MSIRANHGSTAYRLRFAVMLFGVLTGCAALDSHENFKNIMQQQIGKSADDPNISINRYAQRRGAVIDLGNGRVEQEYRYGGCTVYFQIDKTINRVVGWRYQGSRRDCAIAP